MLLENAKYVENYKLMRFGSGATLVTYRKLWFIHLDGSMA